MRTQDVACPLALKVWLQTEEKTSCLLLGLWLRMTFMKQTALGFYMLLCISCIQDCQSYEQIPSRSVTWRCQKQGTCATCAFSFFIALSELVQPAWRQHIAVESIKLFSKCMLLSESGRKWHSTELGARSAALSSPLHGRMMLQVLEENPGCTNVENKTARVLWSILDKRPQWWPGLRLERQLLEGACPGSSLAV